MRGCRYDIYKAEDLLRECKHKIQELDNLPRAEKILHHVRIKNRRAFLEELCQEHQKKLDMLHFELELYEKYGLEVPEGEHAETFKKIIEARKNKLDIVNMVELNLM